MNVQVQTRTLPRWLVTGIRITFFVVLLTIAARVRIVIPGGPVPITAQTLAVLLTGMVLGPVQGTAAVISYVGAIALGIPLDALGRGTAALFGPTAGYLLGFIPGAFLAGLAWQSTGWRKFLLNLVCGLGGILVIFAFGYAGLLVALGGDSRAALFAGVIPFIFVDLGKILLAAALIKLGDESWLRWFVGKIG